MKKLIALMMATLICVSVAACGGAPAASSAAPAPASDAASVSSSEPVSSEAVPADPTANYPLTYTAAYTAADLPREGEGGIDGVTQGWGSVIFNKKEPTILEYPAISLALQSAYTGEAVSWPVYGDDWKGWGYDAIENTDAKSVRTMTIGSFGKRQRDVVMENEAKLKELGVTNVQSATRLEDGLSYVPYSKLEAKEAMTPAKMAEAAFYAMFLQTWHLVPADNQGVMITTPEGNFSAQTILDMATKG